MDQEIRAAERRGDLERLAALRERAGAGLELTRRLEAIREKLATARGLWRPPRRGRYQADTFRWFGAETHRFQLKPPLPETAILAFERQHAITLPQEHRRFLAEVGAEGAGPFYGLLPLERWHDHLTDDPPAGHLGRPLLLDAESPPVDDEAWIGPPGTLALAHQGCAYFSALVVSGPARGRVIHVGLDGPPVHEDAPDFLAWYERWLDRVITGQPT